MVYKRVLDLALVKSRALISHGLPPFQDKISRVERQLVTSKKVMPKAKRKFVFGGERWEKQKHEIFGDNYFWHKTKKKTFFGDQVFDCDYFPIFVSNCFDYLNRLKKLVSTSNGQ